ncbi:MAG: VapB-type antitoxin [Candidatus Bathyarchaeia archaeon]
MSNSTTIRVSKDTLRMLEKLRERLGAGSLDETIRRFLLEKRRSRLEEAFGVDRGMVKPFSEEDRGEDRD